jgi:hypothetical protein
MYETIKEKIAFDDLESILPIFVFLCFPIFALNEEKKLVGLTLDLQLAKPAGHHKQSPTFVAENKKVEKIMCKTYNNYNNSNRSNNNSNYNNIISALEVVLIAKRFVRTKLKNELVF